MSALPPFWRLVEAHGDELLVYARRLTGQEGEDVLQEALLRALRAYPALNHGDHLRAWLYRVVTTTAFDASGKAAKRREIPTNKLPAVAGSGPEEDGFAELIQPLPAPARTALRMRFVDDLDYRAMAKRLGCSEAAARQRVSSAVRTLRKELT